MSATPTPGASAEEWAHYRSAKALRLTPGDTGYVALAAAKKNRCQYGSYAEDILPRTSYPGESQPRGYTNPYRPYPQDRPRLSRFPDLISPVT